MASHPTKISVLALLIFGIFIFFSCSKDIDILKDAVLNDPVANIEERNKPKEETESEEQEEQSETEETLPEEEEAETSSETAMEDGFETRTTTFGPAHDAYLQSGKGYNQQIIRLDGDNRTSYLMFDTSAINEIGGYITDATLEFTITGDEGNGTINVYKGISSDWTETDLVENTAPDIDIMLGNLIKEYKIGSTEEIQLSASDLLPEETTLILAQEEGNDLAIASKEHPSKIGPKLVVTYNVPEDAEAIIIEEEVQAPSPPAEEGTPGEGTPGEDTPEEGTPEEDTPEETTNEEPIAIADASPSSGGAPLVVNFTGSNSSDDNDIKSYSWNFKDGSNSAATNPSHTFTEVGSYEVELTVTDAEGLKATDTVTITVNEESNEGPAAVATATPLSGVAPLQVSFKGSESTDDDSISSYAWNFKDGANSSNANPTHTFTAKGTYEVALTVKDEHGLSDQATVTITVNEKQNEAPKAVVSATPLSGDAPLQVSFTGSNSSDDTGLESYTWNFKDGDNSTIANPSHTFTEVGTHAVELTVTDEDGLTDKASVTITVNEPQQQNEAPVAVADATPLTGDAPLEVSFSSSNSSDDKSISKYQWDFGNNDFGTAANPKRTFNTAGVYDIKLTVTDEEGLTSTGTVTITVTAPSNNGGGGNGNYPPDAVFASSFGFNSSDATSAFKSAMNSNASTIVIDKQNSDWVVGSITIASLRNKTIIFEPGVILRAKSGAFPQTNDPLIRLNSPENVTIEGYGATFRMNKSEYTNGEHRHALSIRNGRDVTVRGLTLRDSGGDGISISGMSASDYSENITIEDVICTNNRRNGLTINSAQNVWIRNSEFSQSNGTNPETGVDLEPDFSDSRLVNINFSNCKFSGNDSAGFQVGTRHMSGSSIPLSISVVDSEFSYNSKSPNGKPYTELLFSIGDAYSNPVKGEVKFERVTFNGSDGAVLFSKKTGDSFKAIFKDCDAINVDKSSIMPPITLEWNGVSNSTLGGYTFDNFYMQYNVNQPFMRIAGPSNLTLKNVSGNFTINEPNNNPLKYQGGINPSNNVNVSINYQHVN